MKIAQIVPPWIPIPPENYGGTESVVFHLVEQLVAQGHDVTLFAPGDARTSAKLVSFFPNSLLDEGVPWSMHPKAFYHLFKSLEQIKTQDFDIVHTHLSSSADLYILPLSSTLDIPHVTTLHSRFPFDHNADGWMGDADNYYMDWAPFVPMVAISEHARKEVSLPLHFVGIVHNGIETQEFVPAHFAPLYNEGQDYGVWMGRFVQEKGAHLAIEAAKRANMPLILGGTVDEHIPDSVQYFQEMIEPQIDDDSIKYVGPVNLEQKLILLSGARCFLNPIEWEEPFGLVMVEAMMSYCPVISFERGAAGELIVDGKTGFLVDTLDEMVQAITRIGEIDRKETRQHAEQHFSARSMTEKYIRVYQKVITQNNSDK
jgi:glycosyltransferase involved in cell wall biosynthesis